MDAQSAEESRAATIVTAVLPDAGAYGRVVRAADGTVTRVVESRDASSDELAIEEFNAGLYAFDRARLARRARPPGDRHRAGRAAYLRTRSRCSTARSR